jgi:hypothetical protein
VRGVAKSVLFVNKPCSTEAESAFPERRRLSYSEGRGRLMTPRWQPNIAHQQIATFLSRLDFGKYNLII